MNHHEQIVSKLQEDLVLRGFARRTQQSYMRCARTFLAYGNRPVEQLEGNAIRHFLLHLIQEKKFATKTINLHSAAIRFLFAVTLDRPHGATLLQVKELLGHASIQTNTIYLHLANLTAGLKSPLDNWPIVSQLEGDTRD